MAFFALIACAEDNNCEDQDCLDQNCASEQTACGL
jgi:hypothetical protein